MIYEYTNLKKKCNFGKGYSVGCTYLDGDLAKMKIFSILFGGSN